MSIVRDVHPHDRFREGIRLYALSGINELTKFLLPSVLGDPRAEIAEEGPVAVSAVAMAEPEGLPDAEEL